MTHHWYEVRLARGAEPDRFYAAMLLDKVASFHHFYDEPWWPGAYVIRVLTTNGRELAQLPDVDHAALWDSRPDEQQYGDDWPWVADLFQASSALADNRDPLRTLKLVHCLLNARGMTERDEAKFAAHLLWNRLTIRARLRWPLAAKLLPRRLP